MGRAYWRNNKGKYIGAIPCYDEDAIKHMLIGRKVVEIDRDTNTIILDSGMHLIVVPGGCSAGNYWVRHLSKVNNAITNVEVVKENIKDGDFWYNETHYRIYIIADGTRTELLDVVGSESSGYYGTGYELYVYLCGE